MQIIENQPQNAELFRSKKVNLKMLNYANHRKSALKWWIMQIIESKPQNAEMRIIESQSQNA